MEYRKDIDLIKGIAIIAVIFYHIGMMPYGFLGVDAFLVINGYLVIPSLVRRFEENDFRFGSWITRRLSRLWPIVLSASVVSLLIGFWTMIPDDYENLSESVVASNLFANNILSAITTRDYWDVSNEFKPLMQMWYLGVVVQFYFIYPCLLFLCRKSLVRWHTRNGFWPIVVAVIGLLSLVLYLFYPDAFSNKFYFIQYRIWEFSLGGFIGLSSVGKHSVNKMFPYAGYLLFCLLLAFGVKSVSQVDTMTIVGMETVQTGDPSSLKMFLTLVAAILSGFLVTANVKTGGYLPPCGRSERCPSAYLPGIR